jgi:hypothetical protein
MKVAFYTSAYFIDSAIETIQSFKSKVSLHLFIEISEISKKSTILGKNGAILAKNGPRGAPQETLVKIDIFGVGGGCWK